jgi:hypothetical protein
VGTWLRDLDAPYAGDDLVEQIQIWQNDFFTWADVNSAASSQEKLCFLRIL